MENTIQFIAKDGDKVVIKKLKPDEHHPIDVVFFLSSTLDSMYNWIENYLKKAIDLEPIEKAVNDIVEGKRLSKNAVAEIVITVNGPKINKLINQLTEPLAETYQKKELNALQTLLKAYALRKAFEKLGLKVDYNAAVGELRKGLKRYAPRK